MGRKEEDIGADNWDVVDERCFGKNNTQGSCYEGREVSNDEKKIHGYDHFCQALTKSERLLSLAI